jgi:hypothetical protein
MEDSTLRMVSWSLARINVRSILSNKLKQLLQSVHYVKGKADEIASTL